MLKCPYCGEEMVKGKIYGDRYQMKWMPIDRKLIMGVWVRGDHVPVGEPGYFFRPQALAHYCQQCNKLIVDLNEANADVIYE